MTLGEKIQILRKQNGLSQEALAEKLAVTRQTVSKWELNRSMPDLDFIARLSELFHVSADYLIKDEMTAPDKPPVQKKAFRFTEKTKHTLLTAVSALELTAVLVCLVCDYFTGVLAAAIKHELSSEVGFKGIAKKVCIFVLVGIANIIDTQILQNGAAIRTAVVFFYLANEGLSCLENAAVIGLPVPEKLKEMLAQLKDERDQDKIDKQ